MRGPRLTYNKVAKAINALIDLQHCVDLPASEADDVYGNVRESIERLLVEDIQPLMRIVDSDR